MKTIGLIGGMSWQSTSLYYSAINAGVKQSLGGLHSAKVCLYSVDFHEIEQLQHAGKWRETAAILAHAAQAVEAGGQIYFSFVLILCIRWLQKCRQQ